MEPFSFTCEGNNFSSHVESVRQKPIMTVRCKNQRLNKEKERLKAEGDNNMFDLMQTAAMLGTPYYDEKTEDGSLFGMILWAFGSLDRR